MPGQFQVRSSQSRTIHITLNKQSASISLIALSASERFLASVIPSPNWRQDFSSELFIHDLSREARFVSVPVEGPLVALSFDRKERSLLVVGTSFVKFFALGEPITIRFICQRPLPRPLMNDSRILARFNRFYCLESSGNFFRLDLNLLYEEWKSPIVSSFSLDHLDAKEDRALIVKSKDFGVELIDFEKRTSRKILKLNNSTLRAQFLFKSYAAVFCQSYLHIVSLDSGTILKKFDGISSSVLPIKVPNFVNFGLAQRVTSTYVEFRSLDKSSSHRFPTSFCKEVFVSRNLLIFQQPSKVEIRHRNVQNIVELKEKFGVNDKLVVVRIGRIYPRLPLTILRRKSSLHSCQNL